MYIVWMVVIQNILRNLKVDLDELYKLDKQNNLIENP